MPLTYPLLFPHGELGWQPDLQHCERHRTKQYNRVTPAQFLAHRMMLRDWDNPLPHSAGMLWQQFLVDSYCMLEANRLAYLQRYQDDLRVEKYSALCATLQEREQDGDETGRTSIGRRVVLPATYAGSPRALQQNYYDAMSMVRECGKPDLFITITANPAWTEVIM
jgi:hypothetical protein